MVRKGEKAELTLPSLRSEAICLGAKTVCQKAFEHSQQEDVNIISELVTDQQALHAIQTFLGSYGGALQALAKSDALGI